jgi:hypothetical protein
MSMSMSGASGARVMPGEICISLPVHTQPSVIAGQLANFAAFLPEARVVLHVSANARFAPAQLDAVLREAGCDNAAVNPVRLPTGWGDILPAHLANIAWIRRHVPHCTRICLHSSNDMLVRHGLAGHLASGGNFLQRRPLVPYSRWRFTGAALADPALQALCRRLGGQLRGRLRGQPDGTPVFGSQIEGSSYEAALLYEITDLLAPAAAQAPAQPYPREEVWLSTVAHALHAPPGGMPYVFSEVHRFDRVFWNVLKVVDPFIGQRGNARYLPRRALEFLMIRAGFHRISRAWVDRIAHDAAGALAACEWLDDGAGRWCVCDRHGLYGVKRVPRRVDAPLRRYIDRLGAETAASALSLPSSDTPDTPGTPRAPPHAAPPSAPSPPSARPASSAASAASARSASAAASLLSMRALHAMPSVPSVPPVDRMHPVFSGPVASSAAATAAAAAAAAVSMP